MGRIIAIDYGTKRIGLAVTDPLQIIASPLETVATGKFDDFIETYLKKEDVEAFVVGYPRQMNNMPSETVRFIEGFVTKLKKKFPGKDIFFADERFTSKMALQSMIAGGMKKSDRRDKAVVDRVSASLILQSFLERRDKERNI